MRSGSFLHHQKAGDEVNQIIREYFENNNYVLVFFLGCSCVHVTPILFFFIDIGTVVEEHEGRCNDQITHL